MLKRYEPYVIDGGYDEEHSIGYRENDNGEFIKYDDYLTEKQSEKEELKKKVDAIIKWLNSIPLSNILDIERKNKLIEQLKSLIGE